ncbi:hypothetical protein COT49_03095 [candidate division WWE3 bacterium CG08_land_8_20_14_0_20_40_13]|uniref:Transcriptional regulator n=1 Tax=candidate division WWE3 bacterium CG08_land_8_20_14_0_20_40_13 TaxID=1975084 RepID=A0A2H0XD56_UNCKA|nr:MAG: hypothetical protein COT49_03095 [candidate division WWE3 bacterium CG08_land_8_20_14_0_20_40_13]
MTFESLQRAIKLPVFTTSDVGLAFPLESSQSVNISLYRLAKSQKIENIKRGVYKFIGAKVDEFSLARILYTPSYVSMGSVLNSCGVIPDVPLSVTSVTTTTSKKISTHVGVFFYSKLPRKLYFGFENGVALPEKALLDYLYIRRIRNLENYRIDISHLDKTKIKEFAKYYPAWLQKVLK